MGCTHRRRRTAAAVLPAAALVALALTGLTGCAGKGGPGKAAEAGGSAEGRSRGSPAAGEPAAREERRGGWRVRVLAEGLEVPWAMAVAPDGTILLTERRGLVRVVRQGGLLAEPAARLDVAAEGEAGLLGLALHPRFPDPPYAYLYYTRRVEGVQGRRLENRVSRFRLVPDARLGYRFTEEEEVLLDGIPAAAIHDGGRLRFGPDGMLYVTTGDARQPALAAEPESLAGKILRLAADGGVPADNPFRGSPVWSFGHRNPQGLAWDGAGRLYAAEHGPSGEYGLCCRDEVNAIARGGFYGWPGWAGRDPTGAALQARELPPPAGPLSTSGSETWAPSGMAFVPDPTGRTGGSLFVACLRGEHLRRLVLARPQAARDGAAGAAGGGAAAPRVLGEEVALVGYGRLRDVQAAPGGCLYILTSNRDGRGRPGPGDDRLLLACPADGGR